MAAMIPAFGAPLVHVVSHALTQVSTPLVEGWALVLAAVSVAGVLLRHRRAHS